MAGPGESGWAPKGGRQPPAHPGTLVSAVADPSHASRLGGQENGGGELAIALFVLNQLIGADNLLTILLVSFRMSSQRDTQK